MTKTNFSTILDNYTRSEIAQMASDLQDKGFRLAAADRDECLTDKVKRSFNTEAPTGGWSDSWLMKTPNGKNYAIFSDGSGQVRKIAGMSGIRSGARAHAHDLAAAILVMAA